MSDKWERAVKGMRESMETYRRRHRPDYAIIARTAWDEEWTARPIGNVYVSVGIWQAGGVKWTHRFSCDQFIASLMRDPRFIELGKNRA